MSVCAANEEKSDEDVKSSNGASAVHPNVLFFGVDDLRPELASYGFDFMHTPSVTRLAGTCTPAVQTLTVSSCMGHTDCTVMLVKL